MSSTHEPGELPAKALDTTAERPWPVRLLATKIADYVHRMAPVWVEGQIVQLNKHNASATAYMTLRDTDVDMSLDVTMLKRQLAAVSAPVAEGAHVVVHAKPNFWVKKGRLSLRAQDIRAIGVGELLARIEHLKRVLAAEGLFDAERKHALPFLPGRIGLICGRDAKAKHDVLVNARARWEHVRFEVREVAVQGANCVPEVSAAVAELDAHPEVDVIIIARGGGSVEDLLPFSNESLVRAVAAATTPVVSAIGHETDTPLLDLVADFRASTPTAAAKRVVPDVAEELERIAAARAAMRRCLTQRLDNEAQHLSAIRARPVLAEPTSIVTSRMEGLQRARTDARRAITQTLTQAQAELHTLGASLRALSPQSTLNRGYAVLRTTSGAVVRDADDVAVGQALHARVAAGSLDLNVTAAHAAAPATAEPPKGAPATAGPHRPGSVPGDADGSAPAHEDHPVPAHEDHPAAAHT